MSCLAYPPLATPVQAQRTDLLRVSFIDVGQGDAIWIRGPQRHDGGRGIDVVIDGGPPGADGVDHLLEYLEVYGLSPGDTIDCVVATHPHDDHYTGLRRVLERYEVRRIVDAGYPKSETTASGNLSMYGRFMADARSETAGGGPAEVVRLRDHDANPGVDLLWGDDSAPEDAVRIRAEILAGFWRGSAEMGSAENTRENNASTVIRIEYGRISFLLMGDAEGKDREDPADPSRYVEATLVTGFPTEELRSTVLKVGHHGSETSSTLGFIRAVRPEVLVAMSGRRNFGGTFLPDDSVLDRYRTLLPATTILRTDRDDASEGRDTTNDADGDDVYMYTDGSSLRVFQASRVTGQWRWVFVTRVQAEEPDR